LALPASMSAACDSGAAKSTMDAVISFLMSSSLALM
jgi:hypothetical protein